ncbi:MAG: GNAT family N-acetyltransferase [Beijerinckiaceae bacterium]|nr:GNAT family N-acetyltransferase [Beijerinckiaceae bacterium]
MTVSALDKLTVRVAPSLALVPARDWDACANPADGRPTQPGEDMDNPFLSHAFLLALEETGCATARTGWGGAHVLVEDAKGALLAAAPCYLKTNSMGEYVFDHGWADAYQRAGGDYYPKLQVSVPFTPATGRRLLVRPSPLQDRARDTLALGLQALCDQTHASSVHVTFGLETEWAFLSKQGFLQRQDQQFHWVNEGYSTFDDFLAALASRKRKVIRRERRDALADNGITIERLTGDAIRKEHWDAFFRFYTDTGNRKWGRPYLTRAFFDRIGEVMADRILLIMAKRDGRYIAGAINFIGGNTLYGRNWGAIEEHPFLHFEVCYYQAIDFAIERGLQRVEAGAQGEHKLARGYRPSLTYSAHYIADPGFRKAIASYLARERMHVELAQEQLNEFTPFRKGEPPEPE